MWDDYEYMSWPERIVNAGAMVLSGIAAFVFFCLNNSRFIWPAIGLSIFISACWTLEHPKPTVPATVRQPGQPLP